MDGRIPMDIQLIQNIKAGDRSSFKKLYDMYADAALRTAAGNTGDSELAKDAVQQTFIRVYQASGFDTDRRLAWFYRII